MITLRPGSHVLWLIQVLATVGELPLGSAYLFGNDRTWRRLINRLTENQEFRFPDTDERMICKLLQIRTAGKLKSVRFYKGALPLLNAVDEDAYRYYMDAFYQHQLPGDAAHIERNHRVAEAVLMCLNAGIEARPMRLPRLQNDRITRLVPDSPSFYLGKELKKIRDTELNKTMFSRVVGMVSFPGCCYAVYNSRAALMKWNGMGEFKTLHSLTEAARLNAGITEIDSAILLGADMGVALRTIRESEKNHRLEFRFDGIYRHIHFVPMTTFGTRLMKLLTTAEWRSDLLDLLFDSSDRSYDQGRFEYDACVDGVYVYSHLDGDIARLIRFGQALQTQKGEFEVLCFPEQVPLLREYLGKRVRLKLIDMDLVEAELCPERRSLFEG